MIRREHNDDQPSDGGRLPSTARARHGFTVVELLVALAVLTVLAALLMPALAAARGAARRTACLSNLHQLGVAIDLYRADYDGIYPYGLDPASIKSLPIGFDPPYLAQAEKMPDLRFVLVPYVRPGEVWHCPADRWYDAPPGVPSLYAWVGASYTYNAYPAILGANEGYFGDPSLGFLLGDRGIWHGGSNARDGRVNELFADQHARNVNDGWYELDQCLSEPDPPPGGCG